MALSLLGERRKIDRNQEPNAETLARLEWLVCTLNPNDNQGFRTRLLRHYLELGRFDDALALSDRYPDDFPAMQYSRILTLFALGRIDEADAALRHTMKRFPKPLEWLLKKNPNATPDGEYGMLIGADEGAWIYREEHFVLWQRLGALDWAAAIERSRKR